MSATLNVVRAEWFKLWRKRRIYILAGLYWLIAPLLILIVARIVFGVAGDSFANEQGVVDATMQELASPFGLARLLLVGAGYMSPTFYIVAVTLIAALLIGDERSQNMWKTVLVVQPDRAAVLTGKIIVAMLGLGVLMFGAALSGALFGAVGTLFLPTQLTGGAWGELLGLYFTQWAFLLAPRAPRLPAHLRSALGRAGRRHGPLPAHPVGGHLQPAQHHRAVAATQPYQCRLPGA